MPQPARFFSLRSVAAYLAWLAVAGQPAMALWQGRAGATLPMTIGAIALLATLLLFVAREASRTLVYQRGLTLAQIPAALVAFAMFRDGLTPVLLIVIAAQLSALYDTWRTAAIMALVNLALLALMLRAWPLDTAVVNTLSYIGFKCFAAFTSQALVAAQRARDEAQRINAELLATRALLAEGARAEERLHLSRELHDVAGHKLTALKLQLGLCAAGTPAQAVALAASRELADDLLTDVRGVVGALRDHDGVDLHSALRALAGGIPLPKIALDLADNARPADFARAQTLLRVAQEGITNALRHAGAQTLQLSLHRIDGVLQLTVDDDGRGPGRAIAGNGLKGLQERLAAVGGELALLPRAGGGSHLSARVPA